VNVSGGNDENKKRLGTLGACAEIVNAMQAFPSDKTVQLQGTWVLVIAVWCPWTPLNPKGSSKECTRHAACHMTLLAPLITICKTTQRAGRSRTSATTTTTTRSGWARARAS
jgi:hypothetical protein